MPNPKTAFHGRTHNLKFRLIVTFVGFAVLLMSLLWGLQVLGIQKFYESMKTREIQRTADEIVETFGNLDVTTTIRPAILDTMRSLSAKDDMFVHIETESGLVIYTGNDSFQRPSVFGGNYNVNDVRMRLGKTDEDSVTYTARNHGVETMVYGRKIDNSFLGSTLYLSIFAPLTPVSSTISILKKQLIIITFVSLVLACVLAYFIANRLSKPLMQITETAEELKKGHYGVRFEGTGYTEVVQLADTLTQTSEALARSDELRKDLIANVSHDLRTPLTMIRSYAEMVRDLSGDNPEKRTEHLNVVIDEADRLNVLVNDLLTLSKMESGATPLEKAELNLADEAENALRPFRVMEETDGYELSFTCIRPEDTTVLADPARIRQVLSNLLTNAFRYSGDSRKIEVSVEAAQDSVRVSVTDHGIGISEEDLTHIWDRYYRASSKAVRSTSGGSGLGLAITKEILELHEAAYGVESILGEGSTFWFSLRKQS